MSEDAPLPSGTIVPRRDSQFWNGSFVRVEGFPLIEHLHERNPQDFNKLAFKSITLFNEAKMLNQNKTIEIDILGLTGLAKTLLREEICTFFDLIGPTFTHDYEVSIALASLQGRIINPSGKRTDEEFGEANDVDNKLMELFLSLPGSKFLVREKPGITQDPLFRIGSTRGDWDFDRKLRHRRTILDIIMCGEEEFRRGNIYRRMILAHQTQDADWASGNKAYVQHHRAVALQAYTLAKENMGIGSNVLKIYKEMSLEDVGTYLYSEEGAMVDFTKGVIKPRVSYFLHGSLNSERVIFFCNEMKPDWRQVFSGYSKVGLNSRMGIHHALWQYSQENGDENLEEELRRMMIPELIEIEAR